MYFNEVPDDYNFRTPSKPLTGTEVDLVSQLSGMDLPAFLDDQAAKKWGFKCRVVPGAYLLSCVIGLLVRQGFLVDAVWAALNDVSFKNPAYPGDIIHVENKVLNKKANSKRNSGFITYRWTLKNQDDLVLVEGTNTCMFPMKP